MQTGAPTVLAPTLTTSFQGVVDDGSVTPPDTMGAVGPNHLVELINSGFTVFDRSGGVVAPQVSLFAFWSSLGAPAASPFDPKVVFDQQADRWVVVTLSNPFSPDSSVLVGISATNDPTGAWNLFALVADPAGVDFADFPGLGIDTANVYVSCNLFDNTFGSFSTVKFWVIEKASMTAGGPLNVAVIPDGTGGFTYQPGHSFDTVPGGLNYAVNEGWTNGAQRFLRIQRFNGVGAAATLTDLGFIEVATYSFAQADAPQSSCGVGLSTNDTRLLSAVVRLDTIWTTHSVADPTGKTEVSWYELDPNKANPAGSQWPNQQGRVVDSSLYFYFPSIAVNSDKCVALGFSASAGSTFASGYFTAHFPTDVSGTVQPVGLLKAGVAPYWKQFGGFANRWGDYSATAVDPLDDTTFWTLQEYAETQFPPGGASCNLDQGKWATWWGSFQCIGPKFSQPVAGEGEDIVSNIDWTASNGIPAAATLEITARDDVPGPVDIDVEAKDSGGGLLATQTLSWIANDNGFSIQSMPLPAGTATVRLTYLNDQCDPGCPGDPDADRNAHIDFFAVDARFRQGEDFDRTGGTDPNFPGCDPQLVDGRVVATCGNTGDWVEYDMAPNTVVADDFISDGRPIHGVRWWGSLLGEPRPPILSNLFASDPASGNLGAVDPDTGKFTVIGPFSGAAFQITEIEWSPDGSTLYATTGGGSSTIHTVDPNSGTILTSVGHPLGALNGLEFDATGTLLGTFVATGGGGSPSDLVQVDPITGTLVTIGPTGFNNIGGLAFDSTFTTLFGITSGGAAAVPPTLLNVNPLTGAAAPIAVTTMPAEASSLEFTADGRLIAGGADGILYEIDPVTGAATPIGPLVNAPKVSGLSLRPGAILAQHRSRPGSRALAPAGSRIAEGPFEPGLGAVSTVPQAEYGTGAAHLAGRVAEKIAMVTARSSRTDRSGAGPSAATPVVGGDTCATATTIATLPFSDTGNTCAFADDYDEICPFDNAGSSDVVYELTPGSDMLIDITLCANSAYDTKLYVYENTCGPFQSGVFVACNDDNCSTPSFVDPWVSKVSLVPLTAGNTYFIVVDGFGGACGDYTIDVTEVAVPPPGACLLVNPDFETGNLVGWTRLDSGSGTWVINDGAFIPSSGDGPLPPCGGNFSAVTDQIGPGVHTLYQDVTIPVSATTAALNWTDMIRNHNGAFVDPGQEFRVEVWDPATNSVLAPLFSTNPGDVALQNCTSRLANISAFIGQTVRIAFTEEDSLFFFNVHLDDVCIKLDVPVPHCGDDIVNLPDEECDGTDDAACPGLCQADCTCPPPPTVPEPEGFLISFHEPCEAGAPAGPPLALYFCDDAVVSKADTTLPACDTHSVIDYFVKLADCCLVHATADSRTGTVPATKDAFLEETCLDYALDIQGVVGHKFLQDPLTLECNEVSTGTTVARNFWGWHTTDIERGAAVGLQQAFSGSLTMAAGDWLFGPWEPVVPTCSQPNMAFELTTETPPDGNPDANGDGIPDQCVCAIASLPQPEPIPVPKNRYLSFVPGNPGRQAALRVTLASSTQFPGEVGDSWWVTAPQEICENSGQNSDPPPPPPGCGFAGGGPLTFTGARLECTSTPHCQDWSTIALLHVFGEHITPGAVYNVQAIDCGCDPTVESNFSPPLAVPTASRWGDVCGPGPGGACDGPPEGVIDIQDLIGLDDKFKNLASGLSKPRADLSSTDQAANDTDRLIDVAEKVNWIDAFGGGGFPFAGPTPCP